MWFKSLSLNNIVGIQEQTQQDNGCKQSHIRYRSQQAICYLRGGHKLGNETVAIYLVVE